MSLTTAIAYFAIAFVPLCTIGLLLLGYRELRSARMFSRREGLEEAFGSTEGPAVKPEIRAFGEVVYLHHRKTR